MILTFHFYDYFESTQKVDVDTKGIFIIVNV